MSVGRILIMLFYDYYHNYYLLLLSLFFLWGGGVVAELCSVEVASTMKSIKGSRMQIYFNL